MVDKGGKFGSPTENSKLLVKHDVSQDATGGNSSSWNDNKCQHRTS